MSEFSERQLPEPEGEEEGLPVHPAGVPAAESPAARGPRGQGRIERIVSGSRELAMDLVELVDLKMQLLQIQVEERVQERLNGAVQNALVGGIALGGVLFVLVAGALMLGQLLGHDALGFLAVAALLFLAAFAFRQGKWQMIRIRLRGNGKKEASEGRLLPESTESDSEPDTK